MGPPSLLLVAIACAVFTPSASLLSDDVIFDSNSKWRSLTFTGYQCRSACVRTSGEFRCFDPNGNSRNCSPAKNVDSYGIPCHPKWPCGYYADIELATLCKTSVPLVEPQVRPCGLRDPLQDGPLMIGSDGRFCTARCNGKHRCASTGGGESRCNLPCLGCSFKELGEDQKYTCVKLPDLTAECSLNGAIFEEINGRILGPENVTVDPRDPFDE